MSPGPEREEPRLCSVVKRFASVGGPGDPARHAIVPDRHAMLSAVIREIDETLLPRQIRVEADTGATALLTVSSRRLVWLETSAPDPAPLPDHDPNAAATWFIDRLETTFRNSRKIAFRISDRRPVVETSAVSCSAGQLRQAAGLARPIEASEISFHEVLHSLEAIADASILWRRGAAQAEEKGPDDLIGLLNCCERAQSNGRIGRTQFKPAVPTCALLSLDDYTTLLIAEYQGERFFAAISTARTDVAMHAWKTYTRSLPA